LGAKLAAVGLATPASQHSLPSAQSTTLSLDIPDNEQQRSNVDITVDQLCPARGVEEHVARERDEGHDDAVCQRK